MKHFNAASPNVRARLLRVYTVKSLSARSKCRTGVAVLPCHAFVEG